MYFNARSVLPKLDELRALCKTHKPTIVCIVESWLDSTLENNEICIENYAIVRADRNRHGGGVLLYVIESLSFNVIFPGSSDLELIILSIPVAQPPSSLKFCLSLFYRPPSSPSSVLDDLIDTLCAYVDVSLFSNFVLLGDFNVNMYDINHPLLDKLNALISIFSLSQVVSEPTRISSTC